MRCISCGAPLGPKSNVCPYCGYHNDVDLRNDIAVVKAPQHAERTCPKCAVALEVLRLDNGTTIERCLTCFGLFFDQAELDALLAASVDEPETEDYFLIDRINYDRYRREKIVYQRCPDCREMMDRVAYGQRSGVVVDRCFRHGVWLDAGELRHLLEWARAGGLLLERRREAEGEGEPPPPRKLQIKRRPSMMDYLVRELAKKSAQDH